MWGTAGGAVCAAPRTLRSFGARPHSAGPCTAVSGWGDPTARRWGRGEHVLAHVALGGGVEGGELHVAGVLGPHLGKHLLKGVEAAVRGVDVVLVHLRGAGRQRGRGGAAVGCAGGTRGHPGSPCPQAAQLLPGRRQHVPGGTFQNKEEARPSAGHTDPVCRHLPPAQRLRLPSEAAAPFLQPMIPVSLPSCPSEKARPA